MSAAPKLIHPYFNTEGDIKFCQIQDALNASSSVLWMLADLFGSDTERYSFLDSDSARHGMFIQLICIANTLEVLSAALDGK